VNISANHLTLEVFKHCKAKGLKVGVWISAKDFKENDDFYISMFEMGVDCIVVDKPLRAMEVRKRYFKL